MREAVYSGVSRHWSQLLLLRAVAVAAAVAAGRTSIHLLSAAIEYICYHICYQMPKIDPRSAFVYNFV